MLVVEGTLKGHPVVLGVMDWDFLAASMGSVVGEKLKLAAERALAQALASHHRQLLRRRPHAGGHPLAHADGQGLRGSGAAWTTAGFPYLSILTDPTTGGVSASFAMLGDLNIAEPKALIGFAGPRVIEQTIKQTLPEGFQRSEFLQAHGMVDKVVTRDRLREFVATCPGLDDGTALPEPRDYPTSSRLEARGHWGIKCGLENPRALLEALGHPERPAPPWCSWPAPTARAPRAPSSPTP